MEANGPRQIVDADVNMKSLHFSLSGFIDGLVLRLCARRGREGSRGASQDSPLRAQQVNLSSLLLQSRLRK